MLKKQLKKFQPKREEEKIPETKPVSSIDSPVLNRNLAQPNKVMVESVSGYPRIYGPSNELRSISLIDWRRWGTPSRSYI